MDLKILGLDTGSHLGMALASDATLVGKCLNFPKARGMSRLQLIAGAFASQLQLWKPDLIIMEAYAVGHASSAVVVIECGTVVRLELFKAGYHDWLEVPPSVLKKWTTGRGNASKSDMAVAAQQRWAFQSPSDDITDAVALAKMGQAIVGGATLQGVSTKGVTSWTQHFTSETS